MKKPSQRKYANVCVVPEGLSTDLMSIGFSKIRYNQAIAFISFLKKRSNKNTGLPCSEVELPSNYLEKLISGRYLQVISPLIEKGIIYRNDSYSAGNNKSKKYNISSRYFSEFAEKSFGNIKGNIGEIEGISRSGSRGVILSYMSYFFLESFEEEKLISEVKGCLKSLKIDIEKLYLKSSEIAEKIDGKNLVFDDQIEDTHFVVRRLVGNSIVSHWIKYDKALEMAKYYGVSLIKDAGRFYIMDKFLYTSMKRRWRQLSDHESIHKLSRGVFVASRNSTNHRLDSNITNMSSELLNVILEDNNLVQVDLSNSQFAILANLIPKELSSKETEDFRNRATQGKFYEFIESSLGLESRKEAKQSTFEMLFSSHKSKSPRIDKLNQELPELMSFVNEYKTENGSNQFAIWLQKYESNLFIDGVLKTLYKKKLFALSKHDSIICKKVDLQKILLVINEVFSKNNFEGKLVY